MKVNTERWTRQRRPKERNLLDSQIYAPRGSDTISKLMNGSFFIYTFIRLCIEYIYRVYMTQYPIIKHYNQA